MTDHNGSITGIVMESGTEQSRISFCNNISTVSGSYVLYWMRNSHRAVMNPSLNLAVDIANTLRLPVLVYCQPDHDRQCPCMRQYRFMIEGLCDTRDQLMDKGIAFMVDSVAAGIDLSAVSSGAAALVTDAGYLKHEREALEHAIKVSVCPLISVESPVIVPLASLSGKEEYAASTLRPKIKKILHAYLNPAPDPVPQISSLKIKLPGSAFKGEQHLLTGTGPDPSVGAVRGVRGGYRCARRLLDDFVTRKLASYDKDRNDPDLDGTSLLSPYLHFGQISPVEAALAVIDSEDENAEKFLDELIVRRELAFNFVRFNENYGNIKSLQSWALDTLMLHSADKREYIYSRDEYENSATHDPYWNAAQNQLVSEGIIHNYMRMYWGKKIIEWTVSPENAYEYMVYLNNRYALDGSDPNSYAGIAWCFGKHDRPWAQRQVFGKVRYMNDRGLKRKFSMRTYLEKHLHVK